MEFKPKIVIVMGDGTLQRVLATSPDVDILVLDADEEDEGTEFINGTRFWAGWFEADIDPDSVESMFRQHLENSSPTDGKP